jgi:hypothetical protein
MVKPMRSVAWFGIATSLLLAGSACGPGGDSPIGGQGGGGGAGGAGGGGAGGGAGGAGGAGGSGDPVWPEPPELPACTPWSDTFAQPSVAPPTGRVVVVGSSPLHPVGIETVLELEARTPAGELDTLANGAFVLDAGPNAVVLESNLLEAGRARATVRFESPGSHVLTATTAGESGTTELVAYASQLPIWELELDPVALEAMIANPYVDTTSAATLRVDGADYATDVRLHGGTSRGYPKKSFRFNLASGLELDGHDKLILRAEWNDKSQLRNWLGFQLLRDGTWLESSDSELVHFRVNGKFYGLMNHVERVDADFLRARGLDDDGSLYEADPPLELGLHGDMLPQPPDVYPQIYIEQRGSSHHQDLRALIETTLQLSDEELRAQASSELATNDLLVYLAAIAVLQNQDCLRKNYYLYRDPKAPKGWMVIPWDLDLSFGHLWTEEFDTLDETITTDGDPFVGSGAVGETPLFNQLHDRLLDLPELREKMVEFAKHLVAGVASPESVSAYLDYATCLAMPELLADPNRRATTDEYLARVEEIRTFVDARAALIEALP